MQELTTGKQKELASALQNPLLSKETFHKWRKMTTSPTDTSAVVVFYKSLPQCWWGSFSLCILTIFQWCGFIFALWAVLSSGVEVNRERGEGRDWWKGFMEGGIFWLLHFHQLFETKIVATAIKTTASLKLTFWWESCLLEGDTAGKRWPASIVKVLNE